MINTSTDTFSVIKRHVKTVNYLSRSWNKLYTCRYLLSYDKSRTIECTIIIHYQNNNIQDLTIELSNMYNCVVGCSFCASGCLSETPVFFEQHEYVKQINTCLANTDIDVNSFKNFYVSFQGIGEPSVVYKEISGAMVVIKKRFPKVLFNIATFGFNMKCFKYWEINNEYIRTLQIPFYSHNATILRTIVPSIKETYNFLDVLKSALHYKKRYEICRVKVNYIVIRDTNDDNDTINSLKNILWNYRKEIHLKISYLNYTKLGQKNGLYSATDKRMQEIENKFSNWKFECYLFGSKDNIEVGCGQLLQDYISNR